MAPLRDDLDELTSTKQHAALVSQAVDLITTTLHGNRVEYDDKYNPITYDGYEESVEELSANRAIYLGNGLQRYSVPTLQKIISMQNDPQRETHYAIIDLVMRGDVPLDEALINDYLHLAHCFHSDRLHQRITDAVLDIDSFRHYEGIAQQTIGQPYPQQRVDQGTAILSIINHMRQSIDNGFLNLMVTIFVSKHGALTNIIYDHSDSLVHVIKDEHLRLKRLITAPGTDLQALTSIVIERGILDYGSIRAILEAQRDSPVRAFQEGVL